MLPCNLPFANVEPHWDVQEQFKNPDVCMHRCYAHHECFLIFLSAPNHIGWVLLCILDLVLQLLFWCHHWPPCHLPKWRSAFALLHIFRMAYLLDMSQDCQSPVQFFSGRPLTGFTHFTDFKSYQQLVFISLSSNNTFSISLAPSLDLWRIFLQDFQCASPVWNQNGHTSLFLECLL